MIILDSVNFGRYSSTAAAKSAVGRGNPELTIAHNRACGFFMRKAQSHQSMVGRAGQPKGWPVSIVAGISTPVRLTTSRCGNLGGGLSKPTIEAVIMATILTQTQPEITIIGGHAVTTSIAVAEYFQKPHKDVLAKLSRLECSPEFTERNFSLSSYIDSTGRKLPCYHITRDGFAFLAMGFTGKKAAKFKEDYISAFNSMEQNLLKQHNAIVAPINGRVLTYYENGVVREQRIISSDQHIATLEEFLEMAERAKYLVIDIDRLKEISLTGRVKP